MADYELREFRDDAEVTTLGAGIDTDDLTFTIASDSGWPDGSTGKFFVVIDPTNPFEIPGNSAEEHILCDSRVGTTVTINASGRGFGDTSPASHSSGATVAHVALAYDFREANKAAHETVGKATTVGQLLVVDAANSFAALANGTAGLPLVAGASTPAYAKVDSSGIADGAIDTVHIGNEQVTAGKLADGNTVTIAKTADAVLAHAATFSRTGILATGTGTMRFRFPFDATLVHTRLSVDTAPTGADLIVDVNLGTVGSETTIYTTQANRPTITAGTKVEAATTAPDVTAVTAGQALTVDIDAVGSTVAGAHLLVNVYYVLA